ncbi:hypothetical protein HN51_027754 [Arachis hypogaea]
MGTLAQQRVSQNYGRRQIEGRQVGSSVVNDIIGVEVDDEEGGSTTSLVEVDDEEGGSLVIMLKVTNKKKKASILRLKLVVEEDGCRLEEEGGARWL